MDEEKLRKEIQEKERLFMEKKDSYIEKRESILGITHPKKHFFKFLVVMVILGVVIYIGYKFLL